MITKTFLTQNKRNLIENILYATAKNSKDEEAVRISQYYWRDEGHQCGNEQDEEDGLATKPVPNNGEKRREHHSAQPAHCQIDADVDVAVTDEIELKKEFTVDILITSCC